MLGLGRKYGTSSPLGWKAFRDGMNTGGHKGAGPSTCTHILIPLPSHISYACKGSVMVCPRFDPICEIWTD